MIHVFDGPLWSKIMIRVFRKGFFFLFPFSGHFPYSRNFVLFMDTFCIQGILSFFPFIDTFDLGEDDSCVVQDTERV